MLSEQRKKLNEKLAELEKKVTELEKMFIRDRYESSGYIPTKTNKIGHDVNCECSRCLTEIE